VRDSDEILVCRLIDGKITYVHRRLWPALVRLAKLIDKGALAAVRETHTRTGAHKIETVAFPRWVTPEMRRLAEALSVEDACSQLGAWIHARQRPAKSDS
jgi:hypothetical protein